MTIFLFASAFLLVLALAIVAWPLWRRHGSRSSLHQDVDVMGRQLRQLQELHAGGALSNEQFGASKAALERRLIDALALFNDQDGRRAGSLRRLLGLPLALAAFMLFVTVGGYRLVGSPRSLAVGPGPSGATAATTGSAGDVPGTASHELTAQQIGEMTDKLAKRLGAHPDDAQGWLMLARSRVALGQHDKAVEAFARAERLLPRDADLMADYADALAMAHGKDLQGAPSDLLQRALQIDPHHAKALALAGTAAFDRKDYMHAVQYWETLARTEPPDGPFVGQVQDGIAEARRLAGLPPAAAGQASASAVPAGNAASAAISGTVTLAPGLGSQASPDDVLFVFARAVGGSRMPVAIARRRVKDLPLDFVLDDSLAMSPQLRLSQFRRVVIGAKVSRSGNAMSQPGDLEGTTPAVDVGAVGVHVEIDHVVPR